MSEWKEYQLGDLLKIKYGKDHKKLGVGNIPVYGSGGIMRTGDAFLSDKPSVLIPRKGTLSNIFYVEEPFWTVDTMFFSKMKRENVAIYTYYFVKLYDFEKLNTGTGVPSMTSAIISNLNLIIPDDDILEKFNKIVKPLYIEMNKNKKQNEELTKLRDELLPLLMNGQVGFKD